MKKRKFTRTSLDELAKKMPVLSKQEMEKCVGGAVFLNIENGQKLGTLGPSSTIRLCSPEDFQYMSQYLAHEWGGTNSSQFENMGTAFSDINFAGSGSQGEHLMKQIIQREIGYTGSVTARSGDEAMAWAVQNGVAIAFYFDPSYEYLYNYDTLMSMLAHEKAHFGDSGSGNAMINTSEDYAYNEQCSQAGFSQLPYNFRLTVAENWSDLNTRTKEYISQMTGIPVNQF